MSRRWISAAVAAALLAVPGLAAAQPANDNFADAEAATLVFEDQTDTLDATVEEAEPRPCGDIGATIWYRLDAPASTSVTVDTDGSDFDTVLGVYQGESLESLSEVVCVDDDENLQARLSFDTEAGETYYIQAGGFAGQMGFMNLSISAPGAIAGTVTAEDTTPLEGVCVTAYRDVDGPDEEYLEWIDGAVTDEDGSYELSSVDGEVLVEFEDCDRDLYITEWYDDAPTASTATPIVVPAGGTLSGIDAVLSAGGSISGRVTEVGGDPIEGICVEAVGASDDVGRELNFTREDGRYRIGGLRSGTYAVSFNECGPIFIPRPVPVEDEVEVTAHYAGNAYESEWWNDKASFEEADLVEVELGVDLPDIDAALVLRPRPDVAVTELSVRNVPLRTDAGELPGTGLSREVTVTVDNLGDVAARGARLQVYACTVSDGSCRYIAFERGRLEPNQPITRTYRWDALGQVGDVRVIAVVSHFDDPNRRNNRRSVDHYALVGGTGFGITL